MLGQLWAIPILSEVLPPPVGNVSPESTAVSFSTAIRAAITRAEQAEARRWTEELELAKERAKEEMREERRKYREHLERERRCAANPTFWGLIFDYAERFNGLLISAKRRQLLKEQE